MNKQQEELREYLKWEYSRHHIGCEINRECNSDCAECFYKDTAKGLQERGWKPPEKYEPPYQGSPFIEDHMG